ncbi:peptidase M36, partial [Thamnocephalis sphaerospora]
NSPDKTASPKGWYFSQGTDKPLVTSGNNAVAVMPVDQAENKQEAAQPSFNPGARLPSAASNKEAGAINAHRVANNMHDLSYNYGFTEAAGNFQRENYGKGGKGEDEVLIVTRDSFMPNNAAMMVVPDGEKPSIRIGLFGDSGSSRDGGLDNDVVIRAYSQGIAARLVGGSAESECLQGTDQASGLSEGVGNFFALSMKIKKSDTRSSALKLADYVVPKGINQNPYSTDTSVNPTNYAMLNDEKVRKNPGQVGELWATILYELHWNLVDKLGFDENKYSANIAKGNTLTLKLVVDSLMLMPCHPTLIEARNALIQAMVVLTGEQHMCELWKAFSKRGLGPNARSNAD